MDRGNIRRASGSQQVKDLVAKRLHANKAGGILHFVHRPFDFVLSYCRSNMEKEDADVSFSNCERVRLH